MELGLAAVLGYLLGSIPFGIVMARLFGLGDLRKIGSGNIGATNVLRTGNKPAALLTLIFDAGKGGAALLLARAIAGEPAALTAGLAALLGHLFPVWLGFRGGKGIATVLGTLLALHPLVGLACCATWLVAAGLSRISSVGGLAATWSMAIWLPVFGRADALWIAPPLILLVTWRHRENIARLRAGTEPKIGKKS